MTVGMEVMLVPSAETIARARQEMDADRTEFGGDGFFVGDAWWGNVGEEGVVAWLRREGLPARRIGGINSEPDVVCGAWKLGVKTSRVAERVVERMRCLVPLQHEHKPWDWWVFCAFVAETERLLVLGGQTPSEVRRIGKVDPRVANRNPAYCLSRLEIVSPSELLVVLRR